MYMCKCTCTCTSNDMYRETLAGDNDKGSVCVWGGGGGGS